MDFDAHDALPSGARESDARRRHGLWRPRVQRQAPLHNFSAADSRLHPHERSAVQGWRARSVRRCPPIPSTGRSSLLRHPRERSTTVQGRWVMTPGAAADDPRCGRQWLQVHLGISWEASGLDYKGGGAWGEPQEEAALGQFSQGAVLRVAGVQRKTTRGR
jgi:hypothetical protein